MRSQSPSCSTSSSRSSALTPSATYRACGRSPRSPSSARRAEARPRREARVGLRNSARYAAAAAASSSGGGVSSAGTPPASRAALRPICSCMRRMPERRRAAGVEEPVRHRLGVLVVVPVRRDARVDRRVGRRAFVAAGEGLLAQAEEEALRDRRARRRARSCRPAAASAGSPGARRRCTDWCSRRRAGSRRPRPRPREPAHRRGRCRSPTAASCGR